MLAPPPRHFLSAQAPTHNPVLPALGLAHDRASRVAVRRAFVEMKQRFIEAVSEIDGSRGDWLRYQVRQAHEPVDLWLLRGAVFSAIGGRDEHSLRTRLDLHRALDSVFPDSGEITPFLPGF